MGNRPSRVEFARLAVLASTAPSQQDRHKYRLMFLGMLKNLSERSTDRRGLSIRHAQYCHMLLSFGMLDEAHEHATIALRYAEMVCDWQSISRALQLRSECLVSPHYDRTIDQAKVTALLERGKRTLNKLEEPPLQLLLDYCRDQARQYLLVGEAKMAIQAVEEALDYVTSLRNSLHLEQYFATHRQPQQTEYNSFEWQTRLTTILTRSERIRMRSSLGGDWQLLSHTQDDLIKTLKTANNIMYRNSIYFQSFSRASYLRSMIYHNVQNVVSEVFRGLDERVSQLQASSTPYLDMSILNALKDAKEQLRKIFWDRPQDDTEKSVLTDMWQNVGTLVMPTMEQIQQLQFFDTSVRVDVRDEQPFEVQAEPESFREHFFNFLMNAAQQMATLPRDSVAHLISISVGWDESGQRGVVEVSDSAGRVTRLSEGLRAALENDTLGPHHRRHGLRYVMQFFKDMWNCSITASGQEGQKSVVTIGFPQAVRVRRRVVM